MANLNESMSELMTIDGAMAVSLVDSNSGMLLAQAGSGVDLEVAAAGNTEVVRAKLKTMKALGNACKVIEVRPSRLPQHALSIHASEFRDPRSWRDP